MRFTSVTSVIMAATAGLVLATSDGVICNHYEADLYPGSAACVDTFGAHGTRCSNADFGPEFCCPVSCGEVTVSPLPCASPNISCVNGRCLSADLICDGVTHCVDGIDEANCTSMSPSPTSSPSPSIVCADGNQCPVVDPSLLFPNSTDCLTKYLPPRCLSDPTFCCFASCGWCASSSPSSLPSVTSSPSPSRTRSCVDHSICASLANTVYPGSLECNRTYGFTGRLCVSESSQCCPVQCGLCGTFSFSSSISVTASRSLSPSMTITATKSPSISASSSSSKSPSQTPSPSTLFFAALATYTLDGVSQATFSDPTAADAFVHGLETLFGTTPVGITITSPLTKASINATVSIRAEVSNNTLDTATSLLSNTTGVQNAVNAAWASLHLSVAAVSVSMSVVQGALVYECRDDPLCASIAEFLIPLSPNCTNGYFVGSACTTSNSFCCPVSCGQCSVFVPSPSNSPSSSPAPIITKTIAGSDMTSGIAAVSVIAPIVAILALAHTCRTRRKYKTATVDLPGAVGTAGSIALPDLNEFGVEDVEDVERKLSRGIDLLKSRRQQITQQQQLQQPARPETAGVIESGPPRHIETPARDSAGTSLPRETVEEPISEPAQAVGVVDDGEGESKKLVDDSPDADKGEFEQATDQPADHASVGSSESSDPSTSKFLGDPQPHPSVTPLRLESIFLPTESDPTALFEDTVMTGRSTHRETGPGRDTGAPPIIVPGDAAQTPRTQQKANQFLQQVIRGLPSTRSGSQVLPAGVPRQSGGGDSDEGDEGASSSRVVVAKSEERADSSDDEGYWEKQKIMFKDVSGFGDLDSSQPHPSPMRVDSKRKDIDTIRDEEFRRRMAEFAERSAAGEFESESEEDESAPKLGKPGLVEETSSHEASPPTTPRKDSQAALMSTTPTSSTATLTPSRPSRVTVAADIIREDEDISSSETSELDLDAPQQEAPPTERRRELSRVNPRHSHAEKDKQ